MDDLKSINLLGVRVTTESEENILKYITKGLQKQSSKFYVVTPNPEILVFANKNPYFKHILNEAKVGLPDGMGVVWAAKLLNYPIENRVTGTDMVIKLCERFAKEKKIVGFLGGAPGVADSVASCLRKRFSNLIVGFSGSEWDRSRLKAKHLDFLFVAFGFPKQEEWIYKNLAKIPVTAAMGVGGAFDYISGRVKRAPFWLQKLGLEWIFRLIRQPWRIKRQMQLVRFVMMALGELKINPPAGG